MTKAKQVQAIIEAYEEEEITFVKAQKKIENLTGKIVEQDLLDNYWCGVSVENLSLRLATPPIADWQDITDERAVKLINEILEDTTRDEILERNGEALEKRYRKTSGTISSAIESNDLSAEEIMKMLKIDTVIYR